MVNVFLSEKQENMHIMSRYLCIHHPSPLPIYPHQEAFCVSEWKHAPNVYIFVIQNKLILGGIVTPSDPNWGRIQITL